MPECAMSYKGEAVKAKDCSLLIASYGRAAAIGKHAGACWPV